MFSCAVTTARGTWQTGPSVTLLPDAARALVLRGTKEDYEMSDSRLRDTFIDHYDY